MRRFLFVVFLVLACATVAAAGPRENADSAFQRGDYALAARLLRPFAEKEDARAQSNLGVMYAIGKGVPQNDQEALKWFRKAAELGFTSAQFNLGLMYADGEGVPQDYRAAMMKWYRKAAEQGNADAQEALGVMYVQGRGVPQDAQEAVKWYRRAAKQGDAQAQFSLGLMYDSGQGVPQDFIRAHIWYNVAAVALSGDSGKKAMEHRDRVASQMTAAQIGTAQEMARRCQQSKFRECD